MAYFTIFPSKCKLSYDKAANFPNNNKNIKISQRTLNVFYREQDISLL